MVIELVAIASFISFLLIITLCFDGYNKSTLLLTVIPVSFIAFILLNNYIWCEYEYIIYNDYNVYNTQVNTDEYNYYVIITNDGAYVVNKSIIEFFPSKDKQLVVTKYKPKYESFGLDNNRIKKVEISI